MSNERYTLHQHCSRLPSVNPTGRWTPSLASSAHGDKNPRLLRETPERHNMSWAMTALPNYNSAILASRLPFTGLAALESSLVVLPCVNGSSSYGMERAPAVIARGLCAQ